jgi:hypothetical protein
LGELLFIHKPNIYTHFFIIFSLSSPAGVALSLSLNTSRHKWRSKSRADLEIWSKLTEEGHDEGNQSRSGANEPIYAMSEWVLWILFVAVACGGCGCSGF